MSRLRLERVILWACAAVAVCSLCALAPAMWYEAEMAKLRRNCVTISSYYARRATSDRTQRIALLDSIDTLNAIIRTRE